MTDNAERRCWNEDGTSKRGYKRRRAKERAHESYGPKWRQQVQVYHCPECGWYHIGHNSFYGKSRVAMRRSHR